MKGVGPVESEKRLEAERAKAPESTDTKVASEARPRDLEAKKREAAEISRTETSPEKMDQRIALVRVESTAKEEIEDKLTVKTRSVKKSKSGKVRVPAGEGSERVRQRPDEVGGPASLRGLPGQPRAHGRGAEFLAMVRLPSPGDHIARAIAWGASRPRAAASVGSLVPGAIYAR